jgi:hypothetical protein
MLFHEVWYTTEYREYCTHIYRNRLADLRVDDFRISALGARTFSPATILNFSLKSLINCKDQDLETERIRIRK